MDKKELILLDACLFEMIDKHAFDAKLANGHHIVAFYRPDKLDDWTPRVGDRVGVEMSPYDMSKGRLVNNQEQE